MSQYKKRLKNNYFISMFSIKKSNKKTMDTLTSIHCMIIFMKFKRIYLNILKFDV